MLILDLCVLLGKTKKELLSQLSVDDLVEWLAYRQIKPFGFDMENNRFAMVCQAIYNSAGKSYKKPFELSDFFKSSWEENQKPKEDDKAGFESFFRAFIAGAKQDKKD